MDVTIAKGKDADLIAIRRADGSEARSHFPKKGPLPHDALHFIVESILGFNRGFWGIVAAGADPDQVQELAKAAGHASAKRAGIPAPAIHQLLQAERIVEAVEAAMWSDADDPNGVRDLAHIGCDAAHVARPALTPGALALILRRTYALRDEWQSAPIGHVFAFHWSAI